MRHLVVVGIVLLLGAAGCGGSDDTAEPTPTEKDLLDEGSLTFRGGTETLREFQDAERKRDIHQQDSSTDATLRREVALTDPVPAAEVLAWHVEQLERAGWKQLSEPTTGRIRYSNDTGGFFHKLEISTPDGRLISSYDLRYEMVYVDFDAIASTTEPSVSPAFRPVSGRRPPRR